MGSVESVVMTKTMDPYYEWLGIPPKDQPPNHYRLLGLELFEQNRNVIDAAANRQMSFVKEYQAGEDSALSQKLLNELSAARLCLLTPDKKAVYDDELRAEMKAKEAATPPARPPASSRWRNANLPAENETGVAYDQPHFSHSPPVERIWFGVEIVGVKVDGVRGGVPVETRAPAVAEGLEGLLPRSKTRIGVIAATAGVLVAAAAVVLAFVLATALRPPPETPAHVVAEGSQEPAARPDLPKPSATGPTMTASPATFSPATSTTPEATTPAEPAPSPPKQLVVTPASEPPPKAPPAPPAPPPAETWEQAETRLQAATEQASSPAEHKEVAEEIFTAVDRAILDSQAELAKRLVALALTSARKAASPELEKRATLLLVELAQPITDAAKDKARQRLSERRVCPDGY